MELRCTISFVFVAKAKRGRIRMRIIDEIIALEAFNLKIRLCKAIKRFSGERE